MADAVRAYVSGSMLPLVLKCAPAGVLPRVMRVGTKDRMGSALHEHMRDRALFGLPGAMDRLPIVAAAWELDERDSGIFVARARHFEWSPPRRAVAEAALCLCEDGSVVRVEGGRGVYERLPPGALLPLQLDLMWAEPEPLYMDGDGRVRCPPDSVLMCPDLKTGDPRWVDPVERNAQTLAAAVLGARFTGATKALPMIIFWGRGQGIWDVPDHYLDAAGLDAGEAMLRSAIARVADNRRRYLAHEPLDYVVGQHCTFCDAQTYCGAKVGALKRYLDDPAPLDPMQLTPLQAAKLAELEPQFSRFAELAHDALAAYTEANGPIAISGGRMWGPFGRTSSELDPDVTRRVLGEEIGERDARHAFAEETSKAAVERAIKSSHNRNGIKKQVAAAMRRVMARIREAGGMTDKTATCYGVHLPEPEVDAGAPAGAPRLPPNLEGVPIDGDP